MAKTQQVLEKKAFRSLIKQKYNCFRLSVTNVINSRCYQLHKLSTRTIDSNKTVLDSFTSFLQLKNYSTADKLAHTMEPVWKDLELKIKEWYGWNQNEAFRVEAESILESGDVKQQAKLFLQRIEFGTAGLRGRMGPGYSQMNDLVVIQTAQGILRYLQSLNIHHKGIVIGYDGRHHSRRFADLTAGIFVRAGIKVYLPKNVCPTPFVPFGITKFNTAAGIMVTASHNPKEDNGYKVYWTNGAQIIPPHDKNISAFIKDNLEPFPGAWDTSVLNESELLIDPLEDIKSSYYAVIKSNLNDPDMNNKANFGITYTAMHGVGYPYVVEAFEVANFKDLIAVKEQIHPDPEFPTVEFPNPEEGKSALDLSFKTADQYNSSLILANDPDADRLAVAEKNADGVWKVFNGNELGALLGWWMIHLYKLKYPNNNFKNVFLLSSTVSSKIVKTIAIAEGFSFEETLTGFKWMGNISHTLINEENKEVLFAFEEAIGFMCGTAVLDKDGISAAVTVSELAAYLNRDSQTLSDKLAWIYKKYGYHLSNNSYFICHEPAVIKSMFENLRNYGGIPNTYPQSLLNEKYEIVCVRDLTTGYDSSQPDKKAKLPTSKSSEMITFSFSNGLVLTLRTSGTEPKVKYYTELCASPEIQNEDDLKIILQEMVDAIINEFIQPDKYGFQSRSVE